MKFRVVVFFLSLAIFLSSSLSAQTLTSSNLPIVTIDTHNGTIVDDPKISADMGIIYNGVGVRNNVSDPFNNFSGKIGIEIRGSTSQDLFPKKQYGLEIQDANGNGIDASLLGLPKKDDWILYAAYDDKTLIRDVLAYKLGRDMGRYASRFKYCELVINGVYQGVYILLEKIKRDKNRVNIDKLDPNEISGDNLTGGYIFKIDKSTGSGGDGWASTFPPYGRSGNQVTFFQYDYPKQDDIAPQQKQYIKDYVAAFETALNGPNFKDPNIGYQKYIDVSSFVDYLISNELAKNPDAYRLSTYLNKKKDSDGGKLYMGPIWDFNLGFGNVDFCLKGEPTGFVTSYNSVCPSDGWLIPFWWAKLMQDPAFGTQVGARWTSLRQGVLQTSRIMNFIDSVSIELNKEAQQRNFQKWPIMGVYTWPNYFVGKSYAEEVTHLKTWTTQRLTWLDQNIPFLVTAVNELPSNGLVVSAYPNPFTSKIQLSCDIEVPGHVTVELFDVAGRPIERVEADYGEAGKHQITLLQAPAASGMYFVKVKFRTATKVLKVVRQ